MQTVAFILKGAGGDSVAKNTGFPLPKPGVGRVVTAA